MYVETKVGGQKLQATVDTGADNVISLPYRKEKGYVKGINEKSLPIYRVDQGMDIQVGP